jgi:FAD/FMN-containing dehydrogenase
MVVTQFASIGTTLDDGAVQALRERLRGQLIRPGDDGYDAARTVWNAMIDHRPALIARCAGAANVIAAVTFAREQGLLVSIKGGGHSVAGLAVAEGGLMIDCTPMKGIRVDPVARTACAEPGLLWGEFDRETQAFGLATVGGVVASTGIAGLTLGGGQGWLAGKHGLTIDNLLAVDVVTADGRLLRASADENPDLFWAMRGAGANFGVVTSFEYRLHPVETVLGGMVIHPIDRAGEVLHFYREFSAAQPDELTTYAAILTAPDGNVVAALVACYAGPLTEGERVLAPLRRFGAPVVDTIGPLPYVAMQALLAPAFPHGRLNYWKSGLTDRITDEAIATIVEHGRRVPSPFSAIVIADCHGAYSRVGKTETAYYHRDLQYDLVILASWTDPAASDDNIRWTRELFGAVEPQLSAGVYVNDLDHDEGFERIRHAYGANYERLLALKTAYDPTNFLRMNQNIVPKTP